MPYVENIGECDHEKLRIIKTNYSALLHTTHHIQYRLLKLYNLNEAGILNNFYQYHFNSLEKIIRRSANLELTSIIFLSQIDYHDPEMVPYIEFIANEINVNLVIQYFITMQKIGMWRDPVIINDISRKNYSLVLQGINNLLRFGCVIQKEQFLFIQNSHSPYLCELALEMLYFQDHFFTENEIQSILPLIQKTTYPDLFVRVVRKFKEQNMFDLAMSPSSLRVLLKNGLYTGERMESLLAAMDYLVARDGRVTRDQANLLLKANHPFEIAKLLYPQNAKIMLPEMDESTYKLLTRALLRAKNPAEIFYALIILSNNNLSIEYPFCVSDSLAQVICLMNPFRNDFFQILKHASGQYRFIYTFFKAIDRVDNTNTNLTTLENLREISRHAKLLSKVFWNMGPLFLDHIPPHLWTRALLNELFTICNNAELTEQAKVDAIYNHMARLLGVPLRHQVVQQVPMNRMQTTHTASVHKSVAESAIALLGCYQEKIVGDKLAQIHEAMRVWIMSDDPVFESLDSVVLTAARKAIHLITAPDYRFIEKISKISTHEFLALSWCAILDDASRTASLHDAKLLFIEGLYEIIRGYNLDAHGRDNKSEEDKRICAAGTFNKLAEKLVTVHPKVKIDFITLETASWKFPKLVREIVNDYLMSLQCSGIVSELEKYRKMINEANTAELYEKVIEKVKEVFLDEFHCLYPGGRNDSKFIAMIKAGFDVDLSNLPVFKLPASIKRALVDEVCPSPKRYTSEEAKEMEIETKTPEVTMHCSLSSPSPEKRHDEAVFTEMDMDWNINIPTIGYLGFFSPQPTSSSKSTTASCNVDHNQRLTTLLYSHGMTGIMGISSKLRNLHKNAEQNKNNDEVLYQLATFLESDDLQRIGVHRPALAKQLREIIQSRNSPMARKNG